MNLPSNPMRIGSLARASTFVGALGIAILLPYSAHAVPMVEPPPFVNEVFYLKFTINHHFSALRMTELAAGTSTVGTASNYAGSPNIFAPSPQKATDPVALNIAVEANQAQRMEIVEAQQFLSTYYGISHVPSLQPFSIPLLATLEQAPPGDPFNIAFLEVFSGHHATLLPPSQECTMQASHADVREYCAMIVASQTAQIAEMRTRLSEAYGITQIPYEMIPNGVGGTSVPEPASASIIGLGLLGFGVLRRKRRIEVEPRLDHCPENSLAGPEGLSGKGSAG